MKKALVFLVGVILLFSVLSVPAFAEEIEPTVTVSSHTAVPNDTITVSVDIKDSPGIQAMSFTLCYDKDVLTFVSFQKGGLKDYMYANHQEKGYLSFVNCETKDIAFNGTIFSVTFTVNKVAAPGEYPLEIKNIYPEKNGADLKGCFASSTHTPIKPIVSNGTLTVGETCENSGHKFSNWAERVKPSCEGKGASERNCSRCGHTETKEIAPLGHEFSDSWTIDTAATEEADGLMSRHCTRCPVFKDQISYSLEVSEKQEFENTEEEVVNPDQWDVLEEIIESEKEETNKKPETNKYSEEAPSIIGSKIFYFLLGGLSLITVAVILIIIFKGKG